MTDDDDTPEVEGVDWQKLLNDFRKSVTFKTGAVMFGESQALYYETLKQHMSDEDAFNLTAHTTECIIKGIAEAAGPVTAAVLQASFIWERAKQQVSSKEVPGQ